MPDPVDADRRRLLETAAVALGAAPFARATAADASENSSQPAVKTPSASFASIEQIDAGDLSVGYAQAGPTNGKPVILLHGWPYDITAMSMWRPSDFAVQG